MANPDWLPPYSRSGLSQRRSELGRLFPKPTNQSALSGEISFFFLRCLAVWFLALKHCRGLRALKSTRLTSGDPKQDHVRQQTFTQLTALTKKYGRACET
uniref:Uncharacterized protein n=1 Tax=Anguilla anguilla TaxID=7936 RepID=A0A0E9RT03_ANGAN